MNKVEELSVALVKVYKVITKLSRQVPPSHRGDVHKTEFFRHAIPQYDWAHEPLSRVLCTTFRFKFSMGKPRLHFNYIRSLNWPSLKENVASSSSLQKVKEIDF